MYDLTLTQDERIAFDWVGNRYLTGNKVAHLLTQCLPEGRSWEDEGEITFLVPESTAWEINDCCEQEDGMWPCFSDELTAKMHAFTEKIV